MRVVKKCHPVCVKGSDKLLRLILGRTVVNMLVFQKIYIFPCNKGDNIHKNKNVDFYKFNTWLKQNLLLSDTDKALTMHIPNKNYPFNEEIHRHNINK